VIGILSALLGMSFYIPLATLYFPMEVAVVPGLTAISWLRGFKPEVDFCQLCDLLLGHRKHFTARPAKSLINHAILLEMRGPALSFASVYLTVRLTFSLIEETAPPNAASLLAELTAYLSFLIARYHFL
jgi:hypothetical protein